MVHGEVGLPPVEAAGRAAVEAALRRRDLAPRVRERLAMVKAAALGQDAAAIMAWSGRGERTVRRWLGAFAAGGIIALADAPRRGRPVLADAAYVAALERAADTPPPALGPPFDVWTSPRLAAYLAEATGVRLAPGWLRALLAARGFANGRPKHTLGHLQDPAEVAAREETLAAAGEKGGRCARAVRSAPPGRDAPGDQSLSVSRLAPHGRAADRPRRRDEPAGDRVRQRGTLRAWARRGRLRRPGFGLLPLVSRGAGRAACGDRAGGLPGAGQRAGPHQQDEPGGTRRTGRVVTRHLAGALQPAAQ